ncbi:hypothetical protein [Streptomyces sp. NBC_01497]|uniref:hypothetical protein n=1 Tax=Streptomyces sp. NBC_01497 TaxID=2903885 RepID=UPI002E307F78|nr:hypothetical protein [Streptomyces sp. NBC_01497]
MLGALDVQRQRGRDLTHLPPGERRDLHGEDSERYAVHAPRTLLPYLGDGQVALG